MNTKNKVQLIGHLGMNPEVRTLENGNKMAKIRIATRDTYTNSKGERITEAEWHNVVAWGKLVEMAETQLQKGTEVMIEGRLATKEYTGKDGVKRWSTEVIANSIVLVEKKQPAA